MRKIVINCCYGGFNLSEEAVLRYYELKGQKIYPFRDPKFSSLTWYSKVPLEEFEKTLSEKEFSRMTLKQKVSYNKKLREQSVIPTDIERDCPILVQVVEELKEKSWGKYAKLKIVEVPEDVEWVIDEYDGRETIDEVHRSWR